MFLWDCKGDIFSEYPFFSKELNGIEEHADYFGQKVQQTERKGSSLSLYLYNFDELFLKNI